MLGVSWRRRRPSPRLCPDLQTSTLSVEERVAIIAYGKGTMPPHRDMLDMATIRGIAVYIEKFRN